MPSFARKPKPLVEPKVAATTGETPKRRTAIGPELKMPSFSPPAPRGAVSASRSAPAPWSLACCCFRAATTRPRPALRARPRRRRDRAGGKAVSAGKDKSKASVAKKAASKNAEVVAGSNFTLALPKGWDKINPSGGATFAALAGDGTGDATLWIKRDPKLDFATFECDSLEQLKSLGGSAKVIDREQGPTVEQTVVTLGTDAPKGAPDYQVVLRASGPYFYYLATTLQPDAGSEADGRGQT